MTKTRDYPAPPAAMPPRLQTDEEVQGWCEKCVRDAEDARMALRIAASGVQNRSKAFTVADARNCERIYLVRWGAALGAIVVAFQTGRISEVAYNALLARANATTVPSKDKELIK